MEIDLIEILKSEKIREIPDSRNYWFIRSYGGKLFDEYVERNYVAIGFNRVPYKYIKEAINRTESAFEKLKTFLAESYQLKKGEDTKWANQLITFERSVKIGDVIVVPAENSDEFAIGEITSSTKIVDDKRSFLFDNAYEPYPEKRKSVNWIKTVKRNRFIGDTRAMISSHLAVSSINEMANFVESNISSLFFRGTYGHFTLRINQNQDINAFDLNRLLSSLTYFYKEICKALGEDENEDLFIKIKVQSKGATSLRSKIVIALIGLAAISQIPKSKGTKIKIGNIFSYESEGSEGLGQATLNFIKGLGAGTKHLIEFLDARESLQAETISATEQLASDQDTLGKDILTLNPETIKATERGAKKLEE